MASLESILDFSKPVDVPTLDAVVAVFNDPSNPSRATAEAVLMRFRQSSEAWTRVDTILSESKLAQTRYLALQILEDLIRFRWKTLTAEQREGIRSYLVSKIIALSSDERVMQLESLLIRKMNLLLVGILKHDWPANWPTFIPDIVAASKTSEVLCENNVSILRLLSEEIFDFSKESLTAARAEQLKNSLKNELQQIFELLMFILDASTRKSLVVATLECLQRYISWIPEPYLFETPMLEVLVMKFLPVPEFRLPALQVLTEVSSLGAPPEDSLLGSSSSSSSSSSAVPADGASSASSSNRLSQYNRVFEGLYVGVMSQIVKVIPPDASIKKAYQQAEESGDEDSMLFVRNLALFLAAFLGSHGDLLESEAYRPALLSGLNYLVQISDVDSSFSGPGASADSNSTEIFKICVEYWLKLSASLYETETKYNPSLPALAMATVEGVVNSSTSARPGSVASTPLFGAAAANPRKPIYAEVLSRVREVLIRHMKKPEEVLIEKDDSGEYVREAQKDTDAIALYKVMRDTMVFLTHLDPRNTEELLLEKLSKQVNGEEWGYEPLNMLCWAIGSISGTMTETEEKNFLVTVIKDLLLLCETKRGKSNKAVIASNIMYVVGQYPRFLRAHWKFLRTVVVKLFEFMHEKHPGVQDMAVDTFLKIAQKCKRRFVQVQYGETRPFIDELCTLLPSVISDLEPHQIHTFYEAAGHMVSAFPDEASREASVDKLMALPNKLWRELMEVAASNLSVLKNPDTLKELQRVLRTNVSACRSVGSSFAKQVGSLFLDMMNVYRTLSSFIQAAVGTGGAGVMATHAVKCMTNVKKEVLSLVATYVSVSDSPTLIAEHFIPPLLDPVLGDYASAHPVAREAEVLRLMTEIINKLGAGMVTETPKVLTAVFQPTLAMITAASSNEYPEHRLAFFQLLDAINENCFAALFAIPPDQLKLVIDSVVWAFKHTSRETGETGLHILRNLLENVASAGPEIAQPFYDAYLLQLVIDLLGVLTDRLHKAHFKSQIEILRHIFVLVGSGAVSTPLWQSALAVSSGAAQAYQQSIAASFGGSIPPTALNNQTFVPHFVKSWITAQFKNLDPAQAQTFVEGLFNQHADWKTYKSNLRDFLITALEIKGSDADGDLFAEEKAAQAAQDAERRKAIPGLANPWEVLPSDYKTVDTGDIDEL